MILLIFNLIHIESKQNEIFFNNETNKKIIIPLIYAFSLSLELKSWISSKYKNEIISLKYFLFDIIIFFPISRLNKV